MAGIFGINTIQDLVQRFVSHDHDGSHLKGPKIRPSAVNGPGNVTLLAGYGLILVSPDGTKTQKVSLGNDGLVHYDDV